ncbi:hypothetical protein [Candidatus Methylacidithermus pantelleriae]|uniref:Uncharacterized protein n=1 Tax=Candidatus Methylacidithermus pantelleriae TaxID=2744239 RepID=A0A8J2BQM5_9BACT|nr:hypothetical protein [Candidatus Methylacidithermus pantelleriae]CAF0702346.1 hypothetical protein MPNT_50044 [Candidatus Methylacidithermus pantelleriae]
MAMHPVFLCVAHFNAPVDPTECVGLLHLVFAQPWRKSMPRVAFPIRVRYPSNALQSCQA